MVLSFVQNQSEIVWNYELTLNDVLQVFVTLRFIGQPWVDSIVHKLLGCGISFIKVCECLEVTLRPTTSD